MSISPEETGARAQSVLREDTPEVRITEWRFEPGASTGHHRHEMDYAIVYLDGGTLHVVAPTGELDVGVWPGMTYFRKAGVEHDVSNRGDALIRLVEIELKGRGPEMTADGTPIPSSAASADGTNAEASRKSL